MGAVLGRLAGDVGDGEPNTRSSLLVSGSAVLGLRATSLLRFDRAGLGVRPSAGTCGRGPAGGGLGGGKSYLPNVADLITNWALVPVGSAEAGDGREEGFVYSEGVTPDGLAGTESAYR